MAWTVEISETAKKQLAKIDHQAKDSILKYLRERIATNEDPRRFGKPLRKDLAGFWKYRVGNYRIIADIQEEVLIVLVVRVGHRKNMYGGH